MYVVYVLVESTENSKTLRFQKFISKIQFLTKFLKIVPPGIRYVADDKMPQQMALHGVVLLFT